MGPVHKLLETPKSPMLRDQFEYATRCDESLVEGKTSVYCIFTKLRASKRAGQQRDRCQSRQGEDAIRWYSIVLAFFDIDTGIPVRESWADSNSGEFLRNKNFP